MLHGQKDRVVGEPSVLTLWLGDDLNRVQDYEGRILNRRREGSSAAGRQPKVSQKLAKTAKKTKIAHLSELCALLFTTLSTSLSKPMTSQNERLLWDCF